MTTKKSFAQLLRDLEEASPFEAAKLARDLVEHVSQTQSKKAAKKKTARRKAGAIKRKKAANKKTARSKAGAKKGRVKRLA